jgi:AcrR family transcriptional regulator
MLFDMGNREDLLEGAKRCLLEKGYAKTTARDIAEAAGVSLAAIGYHYGSKESLLEQAFMAAMEEWFADDDEFMDPGGARRAAQEAAGGQAEPLRPSGSLEEFRDFFGGVIATFPEQEAVVRLNLEMGLEGRNSPSLGAFMSSAVQYGREELAKALAGLDPKRDGELAQQVGAFYSVVMTGIIAQYLMDREGFPSASDLAEGLRYVAERALNA